MCRVALVVTLALPIVALVSFSADELRGQSLPQGSPTPGILNHFQCYHIRPPAPFDRAGIDLVDQFGTTTVNLKRAFVLCAPADKNGEDPGASADAAHLASYGIEKGSPFERIRDQEVSNQFGTVRLDAVKPARLLVPTAKSLTQPPASPGGGQLDHFQCYKVKRARNAAKFEKQAGVQITTQFETAAIDVVRPLRLCAPANKNGESPGAETHAEHLLCYRAKGTTGFGPTLVYLNNQFGQQTYQVSQRREFCVPSLKNAGASSTTTSTSTTTTTSSTIPPCNAAQHPVCGDSCPAGLTCGPNDEIDANLQECRCFPSGVTPCAQSTYPTCGGACLNGKVCRPFILQVGSESDTLCACVAPEALCGPLAPEMCAGFGACPEGLVCNVVPDTVSCTCSPP